MAYHMFKVEAKPEPSDNNFHLFKRNCIAIIDRLIFEYVRSQWKGSSDSLLPKISNASKNDRPLQDTLSNETLAKNIEKYEEIKKEDFKVLRNYRINNFYKVFGEIRNEILK